MKQLAKEVKFATESKLRWWIFHSQENGLRVALVKIGGRVYIDKTQFNKWLEAQRLEPLDNPQAAA